MKKIIIFIALVIILSSSVYAAGDIKDISCTKNNNNIIVNFNNYLPNINDQLLVKLGNDFKKKDDKKYSWSYNGIDNPLYTKIKIKKDGVEKEGSMTILPNYNRVLVKLEKTITITCTGGTSEEDGGAGGETGSATRKAVMAGSDEEAWKCTSKLPKLIEETNVNNLLEDKHNKGKINNPTVRFWKAGDTLFVESADKGEIVCDFEKSCGYSVKVKIDNSERSKKKKYKFYVLHKCSGSDLKKTCESWDEYAVKKLDFGKSQLKFERFSILLWRTQPRHIDNWGVLNAPPIVFESNNDVKYKDLDTSIYEVNVDKNNPHIFFIKNTGVDTKYKNPYLEHIYFWKREGDLVTLKRMLSQASTNWENDAVMEWTCNNHESESAPSENNLCSFKDVIDLYQIYPDNSFPPTSKKTGYSEETGYSYDPGLSLTESTQFKSINKCGGEYQIECILGNSRNEELLNTVSVDRSFFNIYIPNGINIRVPQGSQGSYWQCNSGLTPKFNIVEKRFVCCGDGVKDKDINGKVVDTLTPKKMVSASSSSPSSRRSISGGGIGGSPNSGSSHSTSSQSVRDVKPYALGKIFIGYKGDNKFSLIGLNKNGKRTCDDKNNNRIIYATLLQWKNTLDLNNDNDKVKMYIGVCKKGGEIEHMFGDATLEKKGDKYFLKLTDITNEDGNSVDKYFSAEKIEDVKNVGWVLPFKKDDFELGVELDSSYSNFKQNSAPNNNIFYFTDINKIQNLKLNFKLNIKKESENKLKNLIQSAVILGFKNRKVSNENDENDAKPVTFNVIKKDGVLNKFLNFDVENYIDKNENSYFSISEFGYPIIKGCIKDDQKGYPRTCSIENIKPLFFNKLSEITPKMVECCDIEDGNCGINAHLHFTNIKVKKVLKKTNEKIWVCNQEQAKDLGIINNNNQIVLAKLYDFKNRKAPQKIIVLYDSDNKQNNGNEGIAWNTPILLNLKDNMQNINLQIKYNMGDTVGLLRPFLTTKMRFGVVCKNVKEMLLKFNDDQQSKIPKSFILPKALIEFSDKTNRNVVDRIAFSNMKKINMFSSLSNRIEIFYDLGAYTFQFQQSEKKIDALFIHKNNLNYYSWSYTSSDAECE